MQELAQTAPKLLTDLQTLIYLLSGGMALLILKEVFSFIRSFRKSTEEEGKISAFQTGVKVDHALQGSCLGRLETASTAQTAALIQATQALAQIVRMLDK